MDYYKLNWVVTPIAAVISDMAALHKQIITFTITFSAASDLANIFFSILSNKKQHKLFLFGEQSQKCIFYLTEGLYELSSCR